METNELVGDLIGSPVKGVVSGLSSTLFGYIAAALAAVFVLMGSCIWYLNSEVDKARLMVNEQKALVALKEAQINGFVAAVEHQNEAIEKMRVDTLQASKDLAATSKVIENRYSTVTVTDKTCEGKVKAYEDMLKVFFSRK